MSAFPTSHPDEHAEGLFHVLARVVVGALLFVGAGYLGRATIIDGGALSLVWPAAGIAMIWFCAGTRPLQTVLNSLALALCTVVVNVTTGASLAMAGVFVASNLLQLYVLFGLMRRLSPQLWGFGGTEPLARLRDFAHLIVSATAACFASAAIGTVGLHLLIGVGNTTTLMVWWGRNTTGVLLIGTLGPLLLAPGIVRLDASEPCSVGRVGSSLKDAVRPKSLAHFNEALFIVVSTVALMFVVFVRDTAQPLAFLMLFATVLAGVRLGPVGASLHGLVTGTVAIVYTILGEGPFAQIGDLNERALFSQVFVTMTVVTGLLLAFSRSERDQAMAALGATMDRLRASEGEAADRAALLSSVLDHTREGVAVVQADGAVLMRNQVGRRMLGLEGPGGDIVQPAEEYGLFHPDGRRVTDADMPHTRAFAGETVQSMDVHVRTPDAPDGRVLEMYATPLPGVTEGAPGRAVVQFRDVTADRQERDSLASFAGVVAHDLINPLAGVRGWAQVLRDALDSGDLEPEEGVAMVERIQTSGDMMSQFINDLLSYTVSRDTQLSITTVDLTAVARDVATMRTLGDALPQVTVADGLSVQADPVLVRQLLDNLIGNAIKYVAPGVRPCVAVSAVETEGWLEVTVADNGIGVPEDMRRRIFENFQRAHAEDYRGTGIGLAICRRVVQRHGGTIGVESGESGSRFVFTLPVGEPLPSYDVEDAAPAPEELSARH